MNRRSVKLALLLVLVLALAGTAAAYLTAGGSGSASASSSASADPVTVSAGDVTGEIYPGGSSDVAVRFSNPNSSAVNVRSLVLDTSEGTNGFSVDAAHSGCSLSSLSFAERDNGGAGYDIAPAGTLDVDLASALSMSSSASDDCQGASFTVFLKVGV
jgi:hypothetical protein